MEFRLDDRRFIKRKIKSWNGKYVNDLENIKVKILNYTPYKQLKEYLPELVTATWNENIDEFNKTLLEHDRDRIMEMVFDEKLIPTALKSIQITMLIEGITTHDVTHLLRHSGLSFAADCTGDKYITDRPMIIPSFLKDVPDMYIRQYTDIMEASYELYDCICNDLSDSVHIQDARLVLPRTMETFYYVTGSLFDFIKFLKQRIDMQVQPKSDNILALRMYQELIKLYPLKININSRNNFYVNECNHPLSSRWYKPLEQNKTEETEKMETVYGDMTLMDGYDTYKTLADKIINEIELSKNDRKY